VAFVVAAKFNDDERVSNEDFAKIGGVAPEELSVLEIDLLHGVEFNLVVSAKVFGGYLRQILA